MTPIHLAIKFNFKDIILILLQTKKIDLSIRSNEGV